MGKICFHCGDISDTPEGTGPSKLAHALEVGGKP